MVAVRVVDYGEGRRLIQITDVTQAERLDQTRRDFVANVSHELRTPLTVSGAASSKPCRNSNWTPPNAAATRI